MCGIVGLVSKRGAYPEAVLRGMTRQIAHRGPDGEGVRIQGQVGLGHRRLSIIDPEGGHQPMCNEDETVWITFNGEIYNYKELMTQLQNRGHRFRTHSDTEVVIHAWEEWGDCCVDHLRGMFAFAIADYREGCVFLARDHFGIKPLVWCETDEAFSFCSEIAPLMHTPGFNGALDLQAIDQYLWLQYIPVPHSAYRQIHKLPPAHRMRVGFDGRVESPRRYWSVRFDPDTGVAEAEWVERISAALKESVHAHLVSDVPFGAFLSGGVDSSLVVAEMSGLLPDPVRTFSIGFQEKEFDETTYAAFAARTCGTLHTRGEMGIQALDLLPDLVRHFGEPFGDSSALPTWHVCQLARASVPMVLSGDGADELFAGYGTQAAWMQAPSFNVYDWIRNIQYTGRDVRNDLWRPEFRAACQPRQELFERLWAETSGLSDLHRVQHMDINTYLPFDILSKVDTTSMMHGLEVRTPFVDLRLVEEAAKIPSHFSMIKAGNGTWNRKALLKQVAKRFFPDSFLNRPKMGFAMPVAQWLAPGGKAYAALMDKLLGRESALHAYFQPEAMRTLLESAATPTLWLLLFLEEWLRQQAARPLIVADPQRHIHVSPQSLREPSPLELARQVSANEALGDHDAARKGRTQLLANWPGTPEGLDAASWLALNPPGLPVGRPRILFIADVRNWIFDRHAHTLQARLADEFNIDIAYHGDPVDEKDYDLIHPLEWHMADPGMIHTPVKWVSGIRSHVSWAGLDLPKLCAHLKQTYQGGMYVVSQRLREIFRSGLPDAVWLPHGLDTALFTAINPPSEQVGSLRLGWAGNRASAVKGFEEFIAPLGQLPGVELVFCGYSDRLLTLAEMHGFYEGIDVYVCTSASEGHNNSLMEAASMARAIVTTDVGTVPEFLQDGVSALIVPRDATAIQKAILTLRDDPALRRSLGERARESVVEHFDWSVRQEDYRLFFRKALASARTTLTAETREAFLYEPDGSHTAWIEVLLTYLETFRPEEPVALLLLLCGDSGTSVPATTVQEVLFELLSKINQEAFPPVVLIENPTDLPELIRSYDHLQWLPADPGVSALDGLSGSRFTRALRASAQEARS